MQTDLLGKIDILIEMSKSTSNIDTLKAELSGINDEIESKRKEIDELKKSVNDGKYVKASDKIIDENIKVSLELKIKKLENSHKELDKELKTVLQTEEEAHKYQKTLQEKKEKLETLIKALKSKIESLKETDNETKAYYQKLVIENEEKLFQTSKEIEDTEREYQKTTAHLTDLTAQIEKLDTRINLEKEKLNDTVTNLSSDESYVDISLKKEDENRISELEEKLDILEERKKEIQNDAVMIGNEAKELLLEDDRTGCFQKVKELVKYIKTLPYMDIASISELENVLREAEEKAVLARDEFASLIETKKYDGTDTQVVHLKEQHLEEQKKELENELTQKQAKIKEIDTIKIRKVNTLLKEAIATSETLKSELANYKKVMQEDEENSTPKKRAVLKAALNKKEEELESVHSIIESYEQELEELIRESQYIADTEIAKTTEKLNKVVSDIKDMAKKAMISSKAKDVLAMENDRAKLKELSDKVKEIIDRKKYKETASEIYDQIEMSLGSFGDVENKVHTKEERNDSLLNNFRITSNHNSELNRSEKNKDVLTEAPSSLESDFYVPIQEENGKDFESETFTIPEVEFEKEDPVPEITPVIDNVPTEPTPIEPIENQQAYSEYEPETTQTVSLSQTYEDSVDTAEPQPPVIPVENNIPVQEETIAPFEIPTITPPVEDFIDKGFEPIENKETFIDYDSTPRNTEPTYTAYEEPIYPSEPQIPVTSTESYAPDFNTFPNNISPSPFEIPQIEPISNNEFQAQLESQFNDYQVEEPIPEVTPYVESLEQIESPKERYRVINVEEIEPVTNASSEEKIEEISADDVMVNEFKDDEYIDFDALLDGGNV